MTQASDILAVLRDVCGQTSKSSPIALHEPDFRGTNAWQYVKDCLDTGWVSTAGQWVSQFEQSLCHFTGAKQAIAVSNGTVALRLSLHVAGVRPGDEVLLPPLSFIATANAVTHLGAVPHFVDIDACSLGMSPSSLAERLAAIGERRDGQIYNRESGRRVSAVLPVHVFGRPALINELRAVSHEWGLPLIEDAAEALGSWVADDHCGLIGSLGVLSFNGNKLITTGGGGAVITNNAELANLARHLSTTAKIPHPWDFKHDLVGWNDRLPNLNAALGVAQIEDLDRRLLLKKKLFDRYVNLFASIPGVEILSEQPGSTSNHWLVSLRLLADDSREATAARLNIIESAHSEGILLRPVWQLLNQQPMYSDSPHGPLRIAEDQACRLLNLPSSPQLLESLAN